MIEKLTILHLIIQPRETKVKKKINENKREINKVLKK